MPGVRQQFRWKSMLDMPVTARRAGWNRRGRLGLKLVLRKFDLPTTSAPFEIQPLRLPAGARVLRVGEQGDAPLQGPRLFVWVEVDPAEERHELRYVVVMDQAQAEQDQPALAGQRWAHKQAVDALCGSMVMHVWVSAPARD